MSKPVTSKLLAEIALRPTKPKKTRAKKIKTKQWDDNHIKKYNWLYNYLVANNPDLKVVKESYIDVHKRQLMSIIEKNENWAGGSKEGILFMVARYLDNKADRYAEIYKTKAHSYKLLNDEITDKNEMDEKEKLNWRSHDFFINILDSIEYDKIDNISDHYKYLLLAMLVYQPPIRTSFYSNCKIITTLAENNDKTQNYIHINNRGKTHVNYIINKDKASNYRLYASNARLSIVELNDKLANMVNDSYIKYPRSYLFQNFKGEHISDGTILDWLKKITKTDGMTFSIMRSSYITWFYANNQKYTDKNILSQQMRHSVVTASRNYLKVFDDGESSEDIITKLRAEIELLKVENQELKAKVEPTTDLTTDKAYIKKRRDVIYMLNKKIGSKPSDTSKKTYDIKYDEETKIYS